MTLPRMVILTDLARVRGGAARVAMDEARAMAARGVGVTVFAGDDGGERIPGVETVALGLSRLRDRPRLRAAVDGIWNREASRALSRWIAAHDTPRTIYHLHGFMQTFSPSVMAALGPVAARVIVQAHDYFLACPNGAFFDYRHEKICNLVPLGAACLMRNCDKRGRAEKAWRVLRHLAMRGARRRLLRKATVVLPNAAMDARLRPAISGARVRAIANTARPLTTPGTWAPAADAPFLFVGDMHPLKGARDFCEAGRRAGVPCALVGAGAEAASLARMYPEHRFHGWQDPEGIARIARGARALVMPSRGPEPFGLVIAEALLAGMPVIVSDSALVASDVIANGAGLGFPSGDVAALARAMRRLRVDTALADRLASRALAAGRALALEPEAWVDAVLDLSRELAAGAGAGAAVGAPRPSMA